jgi:hypothetical protein
VVGRFETRAGRYDVTMRLSFVAILAGFAFVLGACDMPNPSVTFDNQTGQRLCAHLSESGVPEPDPERCDHWLEPNHRSTNRTRRCLSDGEPMEISIRVRPGGEEIYFKAAACKNWEGATITIRQSGDQFTVTEDLQTGDLSAPPAEPRAMNSERGKREF